LPLLALYEGLGLLRVVEVLLLSWVVGQ